MPSAAAAPARKPMRPETEFQRLAREMESTKGLDPIPPDQYLYFLGKKESPLQRLLALVRSKTIRQGHRSPYCVDEAGKELRQADLRRELGMDWGNFRRALTEAVARGLMRLGDRHHRAHPHRVFLCGSVVISTGYREPPEGTTSQNRLVLLTPTQRKIYDGWGPEKQARFYADFESVVNEKERIEREALAAARLITAPLVDRVLAAHALPVKRRIKSVQTESVPTDAPKSVQTDERESVSTAPSLLTSSEKDRGENSSSSSVVVSQSDDDQGIFPEVKSWMRLYSQRSGRDLGEPDAQIVKRVIRGMNGVSLEHLARLLRRLHTKGLKPASSYGWIAAVVEEEFRDGLSAERNANAGGA